LIRSTYTTCDYFLLTFFVFLAADFGFTVFVEGFFSFEAFAAGFFFVSFLSS